MDIIVFRLMPSEAVWEDKLVKAFLADFKSATLGKALPFGDKGDDLAAVERALEDDGSLRLVVFYEPAPFATARQLSEGIDLHQCLARWAASSGAFLGQCGRFRGRILTVPIYGALAAPLATHRAIRERLALPVIAHGAVAGRAATPHSAAWSALEAVIAVQAVSQNSTTAQLDQELQALAVIPASLHVDAAAALKEREALVRQRVPLHCSEAAEEDAADRRALSAAAHRKLLRTQISSLQAELHDHYIFASDARKKVWDAERDLAEARQRAEQNPVEPPEQPPEQPLPIEPHTSSVSEIFVDEQFENPAFYGLEVADNGKTFRWMGRQSEAVIVHSIPDGDAIEVSVHIAHYIDQECLDGLNIGVDDYYAEESFIEHNTPDMVIKKGVVRLPSERSSAKTVRLEISAWKNLSHIGDDRNLSVAIHKIEFKSISYPYAVASSSVEDIHDRIVFEPVNYHTLSTLLADELGGNSAFHEIESVEGDDRLFRWMGRQPEVKIGDVIPDSESEVDISIHVLHYIDDEILDGFHFGIGNQLSQDYMIERPREDTVVKRGYINVKPDNPCPRGLYLSLDSTRNLKHLGDDRNLGVAIQKITIDRSMGYERFKYVPRWLGDHIDRALILLDESFQGVAFHGLEMMNETGIKFRWMGRASEERIDMPIKHPKRIEISAFITHFIDEECLAGFQMGVNDQMIEEYTIDRDAIDYFVVKRGSMAFMHNEEINFLRLKLDVTRNLSHMGDNRDLGVALHKIQVVMI